MIPKINDTPQYEFVIPSTSEKIKFRPYLVKEEKVLMTAFEGDDLKTSLGAILDTLVACSNGKLDRHKVTIYDVQFLFNKLRSTSVGDTASITMRCPKCKHVNPVEIDFDSMKMTSESDSKKTIKIDDDISIEVHHPSYIDMMNNDDVSEATDYGKTMISLATDCIKYIMTSDERIDCSEHSRKELLEFVESMNTSQFKEMWTFIDNVPRLQYDLKHKCVKCDEDMSVTMKDHTDFF